MTPQRAFVLLKELFPWLTDIFLGERGQVELYDRDYRRVVLREPNTPDIKWGKRTKYTGVKQ